MSEFEEFSKIARLSRECVITEKIDGTNAQVYIAPVELDPFYTGNVVTLVDGGAHGIFAGSRNRWVLPGKEDNFGFAAWVKDHADELFALGPGRHFGEWWGAGIGRRYGLGAKNEKRFSLFNTARWGATPDTICAPKCCHVVPVIARGIFTTDLVEYSLQVLRETGSMAAPGFMQPEGVVIWHDAARVLFKKTLLKDEAPKSAETPR